MRWSPVRVGRPSRYPTPLRCGIVEVGCTSEAQIGERVFLGAIHQRIGVLSHNLGQLQENLGVAARQRLGAEICDTPRVVTGNIEYPKSPADSGNVLTCGPEHRYVILRSQGNVAADVIAVMIGSQGRGELLAFVRPIPEHRIRVAGSNTTDVEPRRRRQMELSWNAQIGTMLVISMPVSLILQN